MCSIFLYSQNNLKGNLRKRQYQELATKRKRLQKAKTLTRFKNEEIPSYLPKMDYNCKNVSELMLKEAVWTKDAYKRTARHNGQVWIGRTEALRSRHKMFLVNRLLYSLAFLAVISLGLDPSLGVFHNRRSGMALALDLADIFKPGISWKNTIGKNYDEQLVWGQINEKMVFSKMIKVLETLFNQHTPPLPPSR
jgi:CRISPR/Cas system-associated endonuclease Cas1